MLVPEQDNRRPDLVHKVISTTFLLLLLLLTVWFLSRVFFHHSLPALWLVIAMTIVCAGAAVTLYPPVMWLATIRQGAGKR